MTGLAQGIAAFEVMKLEAQALALAIDEHQDLRVLAPIVEDRFNTWQAAKVQFEQLAARGEAS